MRTNLVTEKYVATWSSWKQARTKHTDSFFVLLDVGKKKKKKAHTAIHNTRTSFHQIFKAAHNIYYKSSRQLCS
ncbi:hypothetical protein Peur_040558 [Populus x canadensis]